MDYIVNPSWFYWLQIINGVRGFVIGVSVIGIVASMILIIGCAIDYHEGYKYKDVNPTDPDWLEYLLLRKIAKVVTPLTLFFIALLIVIPSKETLISMMIAKYATKENLSISIDSIKSAVDYIVNAIKEVK